MKGFIDAVRREEIKRRARVRRIYLSPTEVPAEETVFYELKILARAYLAHCTRVHVSFATNEGCA